MQSILYKAIKMGLRCYLIFKSCKKSDGANKASYIIMKRKVVTIVSVKLQARHNWKCLELKAVGESIVRQPLHVDVIVNTSLSYIFF